MVHQSIIRITQPFFKPWGVDLFCTGKKFLVYNVVTCNLKTKYRRSALGFLWTLLNPLAMTGVYYFVFKMVMKIQLPYHLVFILSGVLFWNFVSQTIIEGMESIVLATGLITKAPIPIIVFPFVATITNFITLILSMPILMGVVLINGAPISFSLTLLPIYLGLLFLLVYGICSTFSVLYVILRDLRHAIGIVLSFLFYGTPVIYDASMIPSQFQWMLYLNPFGILFQDLHSIFVYGQWPGLEHLSWISLWAVGLVSLSAWVQRWYYHGLVEQL